VESNTLLTLLIDWSRRECDRDMKRWRFKRGDKLMSIDKRQREREKKTGPICMHRFNLQFMDKEQGKEK